MKTYCFFVFICLCAGICRASVKTNYVYVISNIYNQVFTENVVTQKVKDTHTNYYFTNNVTTINRVYNTTYKTNVSINCDVSDEFVRAASNQANRASNLAATASAYASNAANAATTAGSYASSSAASANQASYQREQAAAECENALSNINARINWFDEHSGETITQINSNFTFVVEIKDSSFGYTNTMGVTSFLDHMSNMFMSAANGFPRKYVSPEGIDYPNIIYYERGTANGKVEIFPQGNYKAATAYRFMPFNGTIGEDYWTFEPAYISTDVNGLRLNYLPTQTNACPNRNLFDNANALIPTEFYWQNGALRLVLEAYLDTKWVGRLTLKYTGSSGAFAYPNGFYSDKNGNSGTIGSSYQSMTVVSHEGSLRSALQSNTTLGWLKTEYQKVLPSTTLALWFPEKMTPAQQLVADWLLSWQ